MSASGMKGGGLCCKLLLGTRIKYRFEVLGFCFYKMGTVLTL